MNYIAIFAVLAAATVPVFAAEPAAPKCGPKIEDCQKVVDDLTAKLNDATLTNSALRQQRINARTAADDADAVAYIAQQKAALAAQPAAPPPPAK